jgi:L-rhamnose mutarotase
MSIIRYGRIVKIKAENLEEYILFHKSVWSEVQDTIRDTGIKNYTIFNWGSYIFSYYEINGEDTHNTRELLVSEPCRQWEEIMSKMQVCVEEDEGDTRWTRMEEIFHQD